MDDVALIARIDDDTTIYISPVHAHTYAEYVEHDNLGGSTGYFIARERRNQFEVLAKVTNIEAAREIFEILTSARSTQRIDSTSM